MSEEIPTTIVDLDPVQQEIAKSKKYIEELRRIMQTRTRKADGSLGEPGALPHAELVKHYKNEPLEIKEEKERDEKEE